MPEEPRRLRVAWERGCWGGREVLRGGQDDDHGAWAGRSASQCHHIGAMGQSDSLL